MLLRRWFYVAVVWIVTPLHAPVAGSMGLWNVVILPQNYTASQLTRLKMEAALTSERLYPTTKLHGVTTHKTEDGGSMDLWNVGILP
jgi:hypothetical protein